jgi:hypothetical protein
VDLGEESPQNPPQSRESHPQQSLRGGGKLLN